MDPVRRDLGLLALYAACAIAIGVVIVVALSGCVSTAAAAAPCRPAKTMTIAKTKDARMFKSSRSGNIYGCLFSRNKSVLLDRSEEPAAITEVLHARIAGRFALLAVDAVDDAFGFDHYHLTYASLKSGKVREISATKRAGGERFTDIELSSKGPCAWIQEKTIENDALQHEVYKRDANGIKRLDVGVGIVPNSLKLKGEVVSWQNAGKTRTARLR